MLPETVYGVAAVRQRFTVVTSELWTLDTGSGPECQGLKFLGT